MKKNLPLYIGVALPLVFIIIIAAIVYLPSTFVNPKHNFIYVVEDYETYKNNFTIKDDKIVLVPAVKLYPEVDYKYYKDHPNIYLYDFSKNASYEISFEDLKNYSVVKGPSSPDGYSIVRHEGPAGIFEIFGSYDGNDGKFIVSPNGAKKKMVGVEGETYQNINVVGWIK